MRDREPAPPQVGKQRLYVAQDGAACSGITNVPDSALPHQTFHDLGGRKMVSHQSHTSF